MEVASGILTSRIERRISVSVCVIPCKSERRDADAQIQDAHRDDFWILNIDAHDFRREKRRRQHAEQRDQRNKTKHERDGPLNIGKVLPSIVWEVRTAAPDPTPMHKTETS